MEALLGANYFVKLAKNDVVIYNKLEFVERGIAYGQGDQQNGFAKRFRGLSQYNEKTLRG